MTNQSRLFTRLTDEQLLVQVKTLAAREREVTAQLIASLGELDVRRLYLAEGYSSLFTYCTQCLHLSEHAAYGRIEAARAARRWPIILERLADGSLTLTTVCLLACHLTPGNYRTVLEAAKHKSKREVEQQVAALRPMPPVPSSIRKLPTAKASVVAPTDRVGVEVPLQELASPPARMPIVAPQHAAASTDRPAVVIPLAPERYKVQFTVTRETHDKLRQVQDLLRHSVPNGDPAVIFDRALTVLLADLQKKKLALTDRPRATSEANPGSRHVPATVRREVWARDGGQCTFVGTVGRCAERGFLEFHHVVPFAAGGQTTGDNLQLRCRAHNQYEADQYFDEAEWLLVREERVDYGNRTNSVRAELPRATHSCRSSAAAADSAADRILRSRFGRPSGVESLPLV